jgi:hypothetical protein
LKKCLSLGFLLLSLVSLFACGKPGQTAIAINSMPSGARIFDSEGKATPYRTPAIIVLTLDEASHQFKAYKPGYHDVPLDFKLTDETSFISMEEVLSHVCISPCCLGIPLLRLLQPIEFRETYEPHRAELELKRSGKGIFLQPQMPPEIQLWVDGKNHSTVSLSVNQKEVFVPLPLGSHKIEFRAPGFEPLVRDGEGRVMNVHVTEKDPVWIANIRLRSIKSGFYLERPEQFPLAEIQLVPEDTSKASIIRSNIHDERFLTLFAPAGKYTLLLKGKTFLGKVLEHSEKITIATNQINFKNLRTLGPWKNIRAALSFAVKKDGAFDIGENGLMREFVRIVYVRDDSASAKIGVEEGDILLSINGFSVSPRRFGEASVNFALARRLAKHQPGETISLLLERRGQLISKTIAALTGKYYDDKLLRALEGNAETIPLPHFKEKKTPDSK